MLSRPAAYNWDSPPEYPPLVLILMGTFTGSLAYPTNGCRQARSIKAGSPSEPWPKLDYSFRACSRWSIGRISQISSTSGNKIQALLGRDMDIVPFGYTTNTVSVAGGCGEYLLPSADKICSGR